MDFSSCRSGSVECARSAVGDLASLRGPFMIPAQLCDGVPAATFWLAKYSFSRRVGSRNAGNAAREPLLFNYQLEIIRARFDIHLQAKNSDGPFRQLAQPTVIKVGQSYR